MSEPGAMERLAARVVDEEPIDWLAAERACATDEERGWVRNLHLVNDIARQTASIEIEGPTLPTSTLGGEEDGASAGRSTSAAGLAGAGLNAGSHWGPLEIIERAGHGGFADVYKARDTRLNRLVALKLVRDGANAGACSLDQEERALADGRAMARVRHPNVATVHGAERIDGRVGIWMDYIDGQTLEDLLSLLGPMGSREAAGIGIELCGALAAVHNAGLVHCDVKAQNVLKERGGRIVLTDFGAARPLGPDGVEARVSGTPLYLPPEVFQGQAMSIAGDIYALGVLLHHLVTRSFPVKANSLDELRRAHERGDMTLLRDARPDLPGAFVQVVERALARDPADRFGTMGQMQKALEMANQVTDPRLAVTHPELPAWVRRAAMTAAVLLSVLLAVGLVRMKPWRAGSKSPEAVVAGRDARPVVAVLPFDNASPDPHDAYFAAGLHQDIISQLGVLPAITVIDRNSVKRFVENKTPASAITTQLGAAYVLRGTVNKDSTSIRFTVRLVDALKEEVLWSQDFERDLSAANLFGMQMSVARSVAEALHVKIGSLERGRLSNHPTESGTAYALYLRARELPYESDDAANATAAELLEQALDLDPHFTAALAELALVQFSRSYHLGGPRAWTEKAHELAQRAIDLDPEWPDGHCALGLILLDEGRLSGSAEMFTKVLKLRPNDGPTLMYQGYVSYLRGNLAEAGRLYAESRLIDPLNPMVYRDLQGLYRLLGDIPRSDYWRQLALRIDPSGSGFMQVNTAIREGRGDDALRGAERLLTAYPRRPQALETAARAAILANNYERAREYYEQYRRTSPDDWNYWGLTYRTSYAQVLIRLGEKERSRELLTETLRDAMHLVSAGDERPGVRREIAAIHAAQGARAEACEWFKRAVDSGWRLEALWPSPLLEQVRSEACFRQSMDRAQADIAKAKDQIEREGISPQL